MKNSDDASADCPSKDSSDTQEMEHYGSKNLMRMAKNAASQLN